MIRIFVALIIPDGIIKQILQQCKSELKETILYRWESEEKIHLTLKFIGNIEATILPDIIDEINFIENYKAISCKVTHTGFFFGNQKPSVLWAGLNTSEHLIDLVAELNNSLRKFNIPVEKKSFTPHITLMRIKNREDKKLVNTFKMFKFDKIDFKADTIALIKSKLHRTGYIYSEINKYKLS